MSITDLTTRLNRMQVSQRIGHVTGIRSGSVEVAGLGHVARVGDIVRITGNGGPRISGEVISIHHDHCQVMTYQEIHGNGIGGRATLEPVSGIRPSAGWLGHIVDAFGTAMRGGGIPQGDKVVGLRASPPPAVSRQPMGARMPTGIAAVDTLLPLARGQRIGVFAGSGVGKTTLLAEFARSSKADCVVFALIGERGRELRTFVEDVLGPAGFARSVVVCATSDQSPLIKRRAAWTAMAVAEYFRDCGRHVLLIVDSITRMAEAHREIALTAGETPSLHAFPPSTGGLISSYAERAGPGIDGKGDITAIFSVLVSGSDMEGPIADLTRGVLDGHIVLSRDIAERGRFPAIDILRSVSRSLPGVATDTENALIAEARRLLSAYDAAEPMIQTGLYTPGADAALDRAVELFPRLDAFLRRVGVDTPAEAFGDLAEILQIGQPGKVEARSPTAAAADAGAAIGKVG